MSGARYVREVTNAFRDCPCNYAKLRHFLGLTYSDARFLAAGIKFCCYFGAASRDSGLVDGIAVTDRINCGKTPGSRPKTSAMSGAPSSIRSL
jgi:hypothetical protein